MNVNNLNEKNLDNFFKSYKVVSKIALKRAIDLMSMRDSDIPNITLGNMEARDVRASFEFEENLIRVNFTQTFQGSYDDNKESEDVSKRFLAMSDEDWAVFMVGARANSELMREQKKQKDKDEQRGRKLREIARLQKEVETLQ
jgi:hypothetical protein